MTGGNLVWLWKRREAPAKSWRNWWRSTANVLGYCVTCKAPTGVKATGDMYSSHCGAHATQAEATAAARDEGGSYADYLGAFRDGEGP